MGKNTIFLKQKTEALQDISVVVGWWRGEIWDLEMKARNRSCNNEAE